MDIPQSLGRKLREVKGRCYGKMNVGKRTMESRKDMSFSSSSFNFLIVFAISTVDR